MKVFKRQILFELGDVKPTRGFWMSLVVIIISIMLLGFLTGCKNEPPFPYPIAQQEKEPS